MTNQEQSPLIAEVDYPKAKELADLTSLIHDVNICIKTCERLIDFMGQENQDTLLQSSLWTSALIIYARCFGAGKRFGITEEFLSKLSGDPVGAHKRYIDTCSKHIAHSVNPLEQIKIGLVLSDPQIERGVIGIINLSQSHITANKDGVDTLRRLCIEIGKKLAADGKLCIEEALKIGKELPLDDLYEKSYMQTVTPGPDDAGRPRE